MLRRNRVPEESPPAGRPVAGAAGFIVVLKPVSAPELAEIRIEDDLFAVGRNEPPFATYDRALVAEMSRRHARLFSERGAVYVADLESKNGTTVNGERVHGKPRRLKSGDEIRFGRELSFRVELIPRPYAAPSASQVVCVTLTPENKDLGLHPIVITSFPFLISKTDDHFARYRSAYPHQVNYVSRRHAHIFLKGGAPYVEDLGSTNGTTVGDKRLEERAVALEEGDVIGFGGRHFVYRVDIQVEAEATLTQVVTAADEAAEAEFDADKTTFVAAADSFLDIFCIDAAPSQEDEVNEEAPAGEAVGEGESARPRARWAIFLAELREAFGAAQEPKLRRLAPWGAGLAVLLVALGLWLHHAGAPERDTKTLLAEGDYAGAAAIAHQYLAGHPQDTAIQALGTEALLKAGVPDWLKRLKTGDFDGAAAAVAGMKTTAAPNPDALALLGELDWATDLQRYVTERGGLDGPVRIFADEARIKALIQRWEDDASTHQRAMGRISALVPEFRDQYAQTLSQLRKLESDDSVYLAAIERLKGAVASDLDGGKAGELEPVLQEYQEKYPRLAGLDALRQDLAQYRPLDEAARARRLGPLIKRMKEVRFATPWFQDALKRMSATRLPPPDLMERYAAVDQAWSKGAGDEAIAGLQALAAGPWADAVGEEVEHKKAVAEQFRALQQARGAKDYEDRLLNFYGALDAQEDGYFLHAIEGDVAVSRTKAQSRAEALLARAQTLWRQYRQSGSIAGEQRLEASISAAFRNQANLLSEAHNNAQQGLRILTLLQAKEAANWTGLEQEINAEAEMQRRSLQDLRTVLEPNVLKAKLALIGGRSDEERGPAPKTAD